MDNDLVLIDGNPSMEIVEGEASGTEDSHLSSPLTEPHILPIRGPLRMTTCRSDAKTLREPRLNSNPVADFFTTGSECTMQTFCEHQRMKEPSMMPPPPPPPPPSMPISLPPPPMQNHSGPPRMFTAAVNCSPLPSIPPPPPLEPSLNRPLMALPLPRPEPPSSTSHLIHIDSPDELIPDVYNGCGSDKSEVVHISPFNRTIFVAIHKVHEVDFDKYTWLLKHGEPDVWYMKPRRSALAQMNQMRARGFETETPVEVVKDIRKPGDPHDGILASAFPKVCASRALTTPLDADVYDCRIVEHTDADDDDDEPCYKCTDANVESLGGISLVYFVVLSTYRKDDKAGFDEGLYTLRMPIYKYVTCGSREAAVAETFHNAGVMGWDVVFSCVMRYGATLEAGKGFIERVDNLSDLAEETDDKDVARVFY